MRTSKNNKINIPKVANLRPEFFLNFEQLGEPAAKNPIRARARHLLSGQTIHVSWPMVEEHMKVLLSARLALANHFTQKFESVTSEERSAML